MNWLFNFKNINLLNLVESLITLAMRTIILVGIMALIIPNLTFAAKVTKFESCMVKETSAQLAQSRKCKISRTFIHDVTFASKRKCKPAIDEEVAAGKLAVARVPKIMEQSDRSIERLFNMKMSECGIDGSVAVSAGGKIVRFRN